MIKQISIFIFSTLLLASCGGSNTGDNNMNSSDKAGLTISPDQLTTTVDPVCKMDMAQFKITDTAHYAGNVYAFCSEHCKAEFKGDPEKFVAKSE